MKTRVLSGLAMIPLLAFVYCGGIILDVVCMLISIMAIYEFTRVFRNAEIGEAAKPSFVVCVFGAVSFYAIVLLADVSLIFFWLFLMMVLSLLILFKKERSILDSFASLLANIYIVFGLGHVALLQMFFPFTNWVSNPEQWQFWVNGIHNPVWLVVLCAFGSDIFAYLTGTLIGKHKLCPSLSPKKTIEGLVGGILGSAVLCGVFGWFFLNDIFIHCIVIGVLGGGMAVLGDLAASAIKRKLGVKDFGHLIPGHGGVLDRIDSILFTAPFVFYYLQIAAFVYTLIGGAN